MEVHNMHMKNMLMVFVFVLLAANAFAFTIEKPESKVYDDNEVKLRISSQIPVNMTYKVDGDLFQGCISCEVFEKTLYLSEGNHTIIALGYSEEEDYNDSVDFSVVDDFVITIESPVDGSYGPGDMTLKAKSDKALDRMEYSIDSGARIKACENCSSFQKELDLDAGEHKIRVFGYLDDEVESEDVEFEVLDDYWVRIVSPVEKEYSFGKVKLDIKTVEDADKIEYSIDSGQIVLACEDCDSYEKMLSLAADEHQIRVFAYFGSDVRYDEVDFTILPPERFTLSIVSPVNKEYSTRSIQLKVKTNETVDYIKYSLDGKSFVTLCEDCKEYQKSFNLSEGEHKFRVVSKLGNATQERVVTFTVDLDDDYGNWTGDGSRFGKGFEKLPKIVEAGDISDDDLAELIRENKLNPGVLNRLIKTGKLGNESIGAILDTQFKPVGILGKLYYFIGFKRNSVAEEIYKTYYLPDDLEEKILKRDDLPKRYADEVKEKVKARERVKADDKDKPMVRIEKSIRADDDDSFKVGKQEKADDSEDDDRKERGKSEGKGNGKNKRD